MVTQLELWITDSVSVSLGSAYNFMNTARRINKYLEAGGGHFEHYL
jgi:hypothetical protein